MPDPLGGFAHTWPFYLGGVIAYLIGSLPSGLVVACLLRLGDPRAGGSGNIGATNLLRTGIPGIFDGFAPSVPLPARPPYSPPSPPF